MPETEKKLPKAILMYGFACPVVGWGECGDKTCTRECVEIRDPEGSRDTVHLDECDEVIR